MEKNIGHYANYYIMCDCVNAAFPEGHIEYDKGWKLVGVDWTNPKPYLIETDSEYTWTDSVKPILRKLESMTEDEATHMQDYMWEGISDFWMPRDEIMQAFMHPWPSDMRLSFPHYARCINWLRSKGFDCDELIESGLAIEKQPAHSPLTP
jgi:hypothetical protein